MTDYFVLIWNRTRI